MASPPREAILNTIVGCLVGGAIGDAAGATWENAPSGTHRVHLNGDGWQLTDDTQLTLATCEALTNAIAPNPEVIAATFVRWFRARRLTGLGASTTKALRDLEVGAHWALSGCKGDRTAGNGAAMRIAPLAFCLDPLMESSRQLIRDVSRITHHNDEAYIGALAVALGIGAMWSSSLSLQGIADQLPDTCVRDHLLALAALPPDVSLMEAARRHGASGYVAESVPFALLAGNRGDELGFTAMLQQVIAAGGDTDTNASLAGQLAGTQLGFKGLPLELVEVLPQKEMVLDITQAFAESVARRVELGPPHSANSSA